MYHYQPAVALEELQEDSVLPNPVYVRDMIIRARLSPNESMELSRQFHDYLHTFGEAQSVARTILEQLAAAPRKI